MYVGRDAWFVGHCIVSPIHVGEKSMALAGSVVTKDMIPNHIYSGVPAKDITDKLGFQFESPTVNQKARKLQQIIDAFVKKHPEHSGQLIVISSPIDRKEGVCWFDVSERIYNKTYSQAEVVFLKENIPLIKFVPFNEPPFVKCTQETATFWKNLNGEFSSFKVENNLIPLNQRRSTGLRSMRSRILLNSLRPFELSRFEEHNTY